VTFGPSPSQVAKSIERHVRNSHAIGRLIVDGVLSRLSGPPRTPTPTSTPVPTATEATTESKAVVGLPLAEDEWRLLSSGDVVTMIESSDDDTVRAIGLYEETHRRRRLVIEAVRRRLEP